jgi:hypothetical protein
MTTLEASDFDKISPTPLLTAYARQFTDIPYTNDTRQCFCSERLLDISRNDVGANGRSPLRMVLTNA